MIATASSPRAWTNHEPRANRAQVAPAQPESQCDLRTGDRYDSTRAFGLVDSVIGIAPTIDLEVMGRSLQPRAPAHGARSGRTGPAIKGRAVCDSTIPPSDWRALRGPRQIVAGWLASRIFARARNGLIKYLRSTPYSATRRSLATSASGAHFDGVHQAAMVDTKTNANRRAERPSGRRRRTP